MLKKKKFLLIFFLLFASSAHAIDYFAFVGTSGTDLNVLYSPDWNSFADTTGWYQQAIDFNGQFYLKNDGTGGSMFTRFMGHDANLNTVGDSISLQFQLKDVNRITDNQHFFRARWFNAILDGNINGQIEIESNSPTDINVLFYAGSTVILEDEATLNDTFKIIATRQTQNFIFDFNYFVNGVKVATVEDVNVNTNSFRPYLSTEANGVGTGQVWFRIDNLSLLGDFPATASVSYSNFYPYLTNSYVKDLNYSISYTCRSDVDANITRSINDVNDLIYSLSCVDTNQSISAVYTHSIEAPYNIKFWLFDTNTLITQKISDRNFVSDLNAPTIDFNFTTTSSGFYSGTPDVNINMTCTDTISPRIDYNVFNVFDLNVFNGTFDANTLQQITVDVNTGTNEFTGHCTDLVGNTTNDTNTVTIFSNCYQLVNESTGVNLTNGDVNTFFSDLTARGYETDETINLKSPLTTNICYSSIGDDTVRFDLNYADGTTIYREFNLTILQDINTTIPVCIASPQDFFEQLFTSSQQREVVLYSQLSNCYNLADYTKYASGDSLSHRAFTIPLPYILNTDQNGETIILAMINGAVEATINLDVLVFRSEIFDTGLQPDELSVALFVVPPLTDSNTVIIYYNNLAANNTSANINIFDGNNTQIYTQTITSTPNNFTVYFDTTTIDINGEVLKIQVNKTLTDGTTETITRYFTLSGSSSSFQSGLGIIFSFIVVLFGLTLVRWSQVLGWFGLLVMVAGIAILAFSPASAAVIFLQAVLLIAGVFIFITYKDETVRLT